MTESKEILDEEPHTETIECDYKRSTVPNYFQRVFYFVTAKFTRICRFNFDFYGTVYEKLAGDDGEHWKTKALQFVFKMCEKSYEAVQGANARVVCQKEGETYSYDTCTEHELMFIRYVNMFYPDGIDYGYVAEMLTAFRVYSDVPVTWAEAEGIVFKESLRGAPMVYHWLDGANHFQRGFMAYCAYQYSYRCDMDFLVKVVNGLVLDEMVNTTDVWKIDDSGVEGFDGCTVIPIDAGLKVFQNCEYNPEWIKETYMTQMKKLRTTPKRDDRYSDDVTSSMIKRFIELVKTSPRRSDVQFITSVCNFFRNPRQTVLTTDQVQEMLVIEPGYFSAFDMCTVC